MSDLEPRRGPAARLDAPAGSQGALITGLLVLLLVIVAVVLIVLGSHGNHDRSSLPDAQPTGPLDQKGVWDPYLTSPQGGAAGSEGAEKQWRPVVTRFVTHFLGAATDPGWPADTAGEVSPELLERLGRVSRTDVPTGAMRDIDVVASGDHAATLTVRYASGGSTRALGVRIVDLPKDDRGWMVYAYADRAS